MAQKPTDADWILKAMVAVAGEDGRLNAREVGLIQKVYQDQTGRSVDVSGVVRRCRRTPPGETCWQNSLLPQEA